jgi:hypothetical protein
MDVTVRLAAALDGVGSGFEPASWPVPGVRGLSMWLATGVKSPDILSGVALSSEDAIFAGVVSSARIRCDSRSVSLLDRFVKPPWESCLLRALIFF